MSSYRMSAQHEHVFRLDRFALHRADLALDTATCDCGMRMRVIWRNGHELLRRRYVGRRVPFTIGCGSAA